ncbi:octanoyl-[acyl-carrier-protein]:protein N-octanoyltransferase LIPT2, mitochondrial-like [Crassostrea virginica]|uniref:Octanoyl-[acyl-carrier-protein]:protein N-octanoyltransferase LIPT2, mitochondrial n=1 Tax=Crassostrea virginica TaxID=6565 RepID=A0A8B8AFV7_CRAVI|nr:putative lipoyltransferase 2, mitochondrial [Crassostrea virginica]XP_022288853.1 putative lipoyltransferase 2, mitochondrial [Crassostrea virginica]XP_022288854.1 putative lipoyltransferase 2, mitochondrial [Crassostrea virginica]
MNKTSRLVQVINLGRMRFRDAELVQNKLKQRHFDFLHGRTSVANDTLLLVEHEPVYTIGIRSKNYNEETERKLMETGADFVSTDRGGLITFHGPGQLVAYPVINLKNFKPSMKWYVCALEKTMIDTCRKFGLTANANQETGVWIEDRKVGAIGIHGSRFVTTHGISLNCNTDLDWYKHIVPCGIEDKGVTSLTEELEEEVGVQDVFWPFLESFKKQFNCELSFEHFSKQDLMILENSEKRCLQMTLESAIRRKNNL